MEKNLLKVKINNNLYFKLLLPSWFLEHRGENGVTFQYQIKNLGYINLPTIYKKIFEFLSDKKDITFVDVGANLGLSCIPIAIGGNKTIAIEPLKINYDFLNESKNINFLDFELLKFGIGDIEKKEKIYTGEQTDCASIILESVKVVENKGQDFEIVEIKRLDSIITDENDLFVKIDVQGFEMRVLKSMENLLQNEKIKYILIEMDDKFLKNDNTSSQEINNFLIQKKFIVNNFYGEDFLYSRL